MHQLSAPPPPCPLEDTIFADKPLSLRRIQRQCGWTPCLADLQTLGSLDRAKKNDRKILQCYPTWNPPPYNSYRSKGIPHQRVRILTILGPTSASVSKGFSRSKTLSIVAPGPLPSTTEPWMSANLLETSGIERHHESKP